MITQILDPMQRSTSSSGNGTVDSGSAGGGEAAVFSTTAVAALLVEDISFGCLVIQFNVNAKPMSICQHSQSNNVLVLRKVNVTCERFLLFVFLSLSLEFTFYL